MKTGHFPREASAIASLTCLLSVLAYSSPRRRIGVVTLVVDWMLVAL